MTSRRACILALCCCAILMQSIGLLHTYVHPRGTPSLHALDCESGSAQPTPPTACLEQPSHGLTERAPGALAGSEWVHGLFAGHDSASSDCSLFDQLTHADLLHDLPTLSLAHAAPRHPDAVHAAWHHATQAAGFLARAPPAIG
jgi:hypothetical protein